MKKALAGIGSLVLLLVLLVGIPTALVFFAGNPIPSWEELGRALTMPDWGGRFLIGTILPLVAWVAWATFAIGALAEIPAQIRQVPAPHLPGLGMQQKAAGALIGAVIIMFTGFGAISAAPASATEYLAPSGQISTSSDLTATETSSPAEAPAETPTPPEEEEHTEAAPTYVVQDGDSLWRIAENTLGAGERYHEIATLNYGTTQDDGYSLTKDHWLNAGWVLTLPADATVQAAHSEPSEQTTQTQHHTVQAGDTMWDVAEDAYGDGTKYTDIFEATKNVQQPTGRTITDPDLILPGEVLTLPGVPVDAAPSSSPTDTQDSPSEETPAPTPKDSVSPAPNQSTPSDNSGYAGAEAEEDRSAPVTESASDDFDESIFEEYFNVRTIGGIGAIMAAGLLTLLGIRRLKQRRNRRAGERISMPDETASTMELELRAVENPMGMDDVDQALRYLSSWAQDGDQDLPSLFALRLADTEIALYLEESMQLPAPFVSVADDNTAWTITPEDLPHTEDVPSAPYPALVTLGQDTSGAHILVDLEQVRSLNVIAEPELAQGALTALAVELATSQWSEDLQITLVGVAEGLPRLLDTGRVRHVDDIDELLKNLRGQADAVSDALDELGVDSIEQARSLNSAAEAWVPEIVILSELPDPETQQQLAELVSQLPRVGVATITNGHLTGEWAFTLDSAEQAALTLPEGRGELPLTPQVISADEYTRLLSLMSSTEQPAQDGPEWGHNIDRSEVDIDDVAQHLLEDTTNADQPEPAEEVPAQQSEAEEISNTLGGDAPYVQLLGPVSVIGARGEEPRTSTGSTIVRTTEFVSFLALNPGSSADDVHAALWPGKDPAGKTAAANRNGQMSKARKWLGNDNEGQPLIPPVTQSTGYRLSPKIRTDWGIWLELIGDDVTTTSTSRLVAALNLVKGQPISGVKDRYYAWAERVRQEMIASVGDAAHELATRALHSGNTADARLAAAIGREIDPINEIFWRDALKAEHQAGDRDGFDRIVNQLEHHLESFDDGYEPEAETQELIEKARLQTTMR